MYFPEGLEDIPFNINFIQSGSNFGIFEIQKDNLSQIFIKNKFKFWYVFRFVLFLNKKILNYKKF